MAFWPDIAPVRAVQGFLGGMGEGMRGKYDTNEKFSDGKRENATEKKSKAGRFASDNLGLLGSREKGNQIGKWAGALAGGGLMAHFLFTAYMPAMFAAGALAGAWPFIGAALLIGGATWAGANIGAVVLRNVAKPIGTVLGAAVGAVVGAYSAVFRRGVYRREDEQKPVVDAPAPEAAPAVAPVVGGPETAQQQAGAQQNQASSVGLPGQEASVQPQAGMTHSHQQQQEAAPTLGNGQQPQQQKKPFSIGKTLGIGAALAGGAALFSRFRGHGSNLVPSEPSSKAGVPPSDISPSGQALSTQAFGTPATIPHLPRIEETVRVQADNEQGHAAARYVPEEVIPDPVLEFREPMEKAALSRAQQQAEEGLARGDIRSDMLLPPDSKVDEAVLSRSAGSHVAAEQPRGQGSAPASRR